jgi:signal transduction histidine kinase
LERPTATERRRQPSPLVADGLLAAAVFAFTIVGTVLWVPTGPHAGPVLDRVHLLEVVLVVAACAPLAWRRRAPITTLALTTIATVAYVAAGYPSDFLLAPVLATYSAAAHRDRRAVFTLALPLSLVAGLTVQLFGSDWSGPSEFLAGLVFMVGFPILFGQIVFDRRQGLARDRERAARDAVAEERARIARELHDVVAHAMGVMVVQAGAARMVIERDPAGATAALQRIEDTGRIGLAEMRRLIGVLSTGERDSPLGPAPGLERLDELLETFRGAGLPTESVLEGTPRPLPPGVDLAAYRLVQEALTNSLKHAGAAHARVWLRYAGDALEIEVADDGRGPPVDGSGTAGQGLIGMRERVALFNGSLEAGARQGGGFVVRARIPLLEAT